MSGAYWKCPYCHCSRATFSVRPPLADKPIKFKCFRCAKWGDELDLLTFFYPNETYAQRLERMESLQDDYDRKVPPPRPSSPRGSGSEVPEAADDPRAMHMAFANMTDKQRTVLATARKVWHDVTQGHISIDSLSAYCLAYELFQHEERRRQAIEKRFTRNGRSNAKGNS